MNCRQKTIFDSTIVFYTVIIVLSMIFSSSNAKMPAEVSFAGGIAVPHGDLRLRFSREDNRGASILAGIDEFVSPVVSVGLRGSYTGFDHTYYWELGGRVAANPRSFNRFGPFFHAVFGVHTPKLAVRPSTSFGYGAGLGLRIPLSEAGNQRMLLESTYYITEDARMLALRFGFAFGV